MFYLSILILIVGVLLKEFKKESKILDNIYLGSIIFLIVIAWLRFGLGTDYFSYEYIYESINPNNLIDSFRASNNIEPLFKFVMILFRLLRVPYTIFVGLMSTIIILLMNNFIKKLSPNKYLSLLLYLSTFYIVWVLSALRQGIVIAVLLNVYFTDNELKKYQKFIITILLFFIHPSAIFAGIIYILSLVKVPKKYYLVLAVVSLFFQFIPKELYIGIFESTKYLNKIVFYIDEYPISIFSFTVLMRVFFFSLTYLYYDRIIEKYSNEIMMNFILINYIVYFFLLFSSLTASRLSIYGYICLVIVVPMIKDLYTNTRSQSIVVCLIVMFSLISLNKELTTLVEQTGYNGGIVGINFETIFNKDRNKFSDVFNFETNNNEINKEYTNNYHSKRVIPREAEAEYIDTLVHLSVKFDNVGLFGVINENGQIVELPEELVRSKVVGEYIQTVYNPFDFSTKIYRSLLTKENLSFHETIKLIEKDIVDEIKSDVYWYKKDVMDIKELHKIDRIKDRNLDKVKSVETYQNDLYEDILYIKINTPLLSYYAILNNELQMINENLYTKIEPFDNNRIFKGYTKDAIHYINIDGEVIWIESRF